MPAAAVASFTPATSGMSGTSVGARGETAVDIGDFRLRGKGAALYHLHCPYGRGVLAVSPRRGRRRHQHRLQRWNEPRPFAVRGDRPIDLLGRLHDMDAGER